MANKRRRSQGDCSHQQACRPHERTCRGMMSENNAEGWRTTGGPANSANGKEVTAESTLCAAQNLSVEHSVKKFSFPVTYWVFPKLDLM